MKRTLLVLSTMLLAVPPSEANQRFTLRHHVLNANSDIIYTHPKINKQNTSQIFLSDEENIYTRTLVRAPSAWKITEGSEDIIVAVIDSGIEISHPDLKNNLWTNEKEKSGKTGIDDDGNGFIDDIHGWDFVRNRPASVDGTGHGTHCAGNIAATRNGFGVVGVAPKVKIMSVRFLDSNGSGKSENAIRAMEYAVQNGAHILSNSWGGSRYDEAMEAAVKEVHDAGVIFVASANNNGRNIDNSPSYPASYFGAIAIGSSDESDSRSSFSNFGKKTVFIFAPGSESYSTYTNGSYEFLSGTSMAAPQVAGAFALAKSINKNLNTNQIKQSMCAGAKKILTSVSQCGRLNLESFLQKITKI